NTPGVFQLYSRGLATSRDAWVYNFSARAVEENVRRMIEFYNSEVDRYQQADGAAKKIKVEDFVDFDSTQFTWDAINKTDIVRGKKGTFDPSKVRASLYRPFCKQSVYFDLTNQFNNRTYQLQKLFPTPEHENIAIITSVAGTKDFSVLITDTLPDLHSWEMLRPLASTPMSRSLRMTEDSTSTWAAARSWTATPARRTLPTLPWRHTAAPMVTRASRRRISSTTSTRCCTTPSTVRSTQQI
ncbi:MAG: hypothetical protein KHY97_08760, partial [Rothia mucilaginosa]|nr:hypothetical protein [Rothia mucilaginosa]